MLGYLNVALKNIFKGLENIYVTTTSLLYEMSSSTVSSTVFEVPYDVNGENDGKVLSCIDISNVLDLLRFVNISFRQRRLKRCSVNVNDLIIFRYFK